MAPPSHRTPPPATPLLPWRCVGGRQGRGVGRGRPRLPCLPSGRARGPSATALTRPCRALLRRGPCDAVPSRATRRLAQRAHPQPADPPLR
eukprot:980035-Prymnesium_polylepis.1